MVVCGGLLMDGKLHLVNMIIDHNLFLNRFNIIAMPTFESFSSLKL